MLSEVRMKTKNFSSILIYVSIFMLFIFSAVLSAQQLYKVKDKVQIKAVPFDLSEVGLLDSPFKKAMQLDADYLLLIEPDRLLSWFRKEAGLQPKGEVYGGWEKEGIAGHSLGHYLTACSMMYASTGDKRFCERVNYIVDELELCQNANGNGYVAAIPNGKKVFEEVAAGNIRSAGFDLNGVWVPWYTLHKEIAGLLDAQQYCNNGKALAIAVKLADFAYETTKNLTEELFQKMLDCEHGGMNEVLAEIYARTGNEKYLNLSEKFHHKAVLDPLTHKEDKLAGRHANTNIPKLIGLSRRYLLTGFENDRIAAEFFWGRVVHHHSYVIGGNSMNEYLGQPDKLNNRIIGNTCETCNTYNMLKLTRNLFEQNPNTDYADYYERALYNHILSSQNPKDGMTCYFVPLKPGGHKEYSDQFNSFWCCTGTGMENHAKYGESIFFHNDKNLWVNLFIPSELNWKEKGLIVKQETQFPESDKINFTFTCENPTELTLQIRYPFWAENGINILVNGKPFEVKQKSSSYIEIKRTWMNGDKVEVQIPMSLRLETMPDNQNRVAVCYGPVVLAGELGAEDDTKAKNFDYVPVFITEGRPVNDWIKTLPENQLTFTTVSAGTPRDVTLYPFYKMHNKRYSVYWDLFTQEQWIKKQEDYKAELERLRKLEEVTTDFIQPGEMQPERDHNMQGEKTSAGEAFDKKFRVANEGGWFSFDMKVLPDKPNVLICTYWGSDRGNREFDILIEGKTIATQTLQNNKPNEFFDEKYPIPDEMTKGKDKVTVQFKAHRASTAGGVFGVRIIR